VSFGNPRWCHSARRKLISGCTGHNSFSAVTVFTPLSKASRFEDWFRRGSCQRWVIDSNSCPRPHSTFQCSAVFQTMRRFIDDAPVTRQRARHPHKLTWVLTGRQLRLAQQVHVCRLRRDPEYWQARVRDAGRKRRRSMRGIHWTDKPTRLRLVPQTRAGTMRRNEYPQARGGAHEGQKENQWKPTA
jgi:hypothetical protein